MPEELKFADGGTDLEFGVFLFGLLRKVDVVMTDEGWFARSVSLSEDEARSLRDWLDRFLDDRPGPAHSPECEFGSMQDRWCWRCRYEWLERRIEASRG